jgi:thiol-disulfide isomerase/thioredoxin
MLCLSVVLVVCAGLQAGAKHAAPEASPAEQLRALKAEGDLAWRDFNRSDVPGTEEAVRKRAAERYRTREADLVRRVLTLAKDHPGATEAPAALNWAFGELLGGYFGKRPAECDAICAAVTERFLDRPEILPLLGGIWADAGWAPQVRPFLETALKRSTNRDIQGTACYSLAKAHERLAEAHRILADPLGGEIARRNYGPDNVRRVLALDRAQLKHEAAAYYTQTIQEYASVQPFKARPTLGEQARSSLFRIQNLDIGCTIPDIDAKDLDGKPIKLSDYRGKVLLVAFWAGWCGPCMGMVPIEKALVDRMSGRPFAMVGVNGDETADEGRSVAAKNKINWRSVWDGGSRGTTATRWGVQGWPTSYLVDAKGVIRESNLRGHDLDKAVEALVAETEAAAANPQVTGKTASGR